MAATIKTIVLANITASAGGEQITTTAKTWASSFEIQAASGNTGVIYVGGSDVAATSRFLASSGTYAISQDHTTNEEIDLSTVYVLSANGTEDAVVTYISRA